MVAEAVTSHKPLGELVDHLPQSLRGIDIAGIRCDSRQVGPGDLFLAYPGQSTDGRRYIPQAIANGAAAVIAESGATIEDGSVPAVERSPVIERTNVMAQVSAIAGRFFGRPSEKMRLVGVTGTNGKTSCSQIIGQMLRAMGGQCGVSGTLGASLDGSIAEGSLTTPDAVTLQGIIADWYNRGVHYGVMEVSSHGLAQHRVAGVKFAAAVFTNLSRDHLDYHGDMDAYAAEKYKLFRQPGLQFVVINRDDDYGRRLVSTLAPDLRCLQYSVQDSDADIFCREVAYRHDGFDALLCTPWGETRLHSPLMGEFNLSNVLAAVGVLGGLEFSLVDIAAAASRVQAVPGRMQTVEDTGDIDVVIDYAHTPDALEKALTVLRKHCRAQLWCVFGCGGDRDRGKRSLMGGIAARLADHIIVTSDNPRTENPQQIIDDVLAGVGDNAEAILERSEAVRHALTQAQAGDMVLIAGKGHEKYQIVGDKKLPYSDLRVVQQTLRPGGVQ